MRADDITPRDCAVMAAAYADCAAITKKLGDSIEEGGKSGALDGSAAALILMTLSTLQAGFEGKAENLRVAADARASGEEA